MLAFWLLLFLRSLLSLWLWLLWLLRVCPLWLRLLDWCSEDSIQEATEVNLSTALGISLVTSNLLKEVVEDAAEVWLAWGSSWSSWVQTAEQLCQVAERIGRLSLWLSLRSLWGWLGISLVLR